MYAIIRMPTPSDVPTLRSFIGMLNYYGQFIEEMRQLRSPLDKLLTKDAVFMWSRVKDHSRRRNKSYNLIFC